MHFVVAYSIGIAVVCGAAYLGYKLAEKGEDDELLQKAIFLAVVSLVTLLIISITKELMCRPRFRYVLATNDLDYFRSWWQSGREIKESLGNDVVTDEFASLPSGHSAYSMFAIFLFPTIADYVGKLKKIQAASFCTWLCLVGDNSILTPHHWSTLSYRRNDCRTCHNPFIHSCFGYKEDLFKAKVIEKQTIK